MAWMAPYWMDLWPGATEEETREWWESNRKIQNDFVEQFNNDWLNRHMRLVSFGRLPNARRMKMVPSYDEVVEEYKRQKKS